MVESRDRTISIIIPVYNAEKALKRCIDSVVNQSYKDIQVILVNDGSEDKSLAICHEWSRIDRRVMVVDKQNGGVSSARNAGLRVATGSYIQFVDSDDFLDPDFCGNLLDSAILSDSDVVISGYRYFNSGKVHENSPGLKSSVYTKKEIAQQFSTLYSGPFLSSPCNKLYHSFAVADCGFDESVRMGEDLIFNMDVLKNCDTISIIPSTGYYYDVTGANSASSTYAPVGCDSLIKYVASIHRFLSDSLSNDFAKTICNEIITAGAIADLKRIARHAPEKAQSIRLYMDELRKKTAIKNLKDDLSHFSIGWYDRLLVRLINSSKYGLFLVNEHILRIIEKVR